MIGGGIEVYNNGWSWDVAVAVAVAVAAGAVGGFGSSIGKAAFFGALGSGGNNAYQQGIDPYKEFDWEEFGKSTACKFHSHLSTHFTLMFPPVS